MSDKFTVETLLEMGDSMRQSFIVAASPEERVMGLEPEERMVGLNREEKFLLIEALRLSIEADEAS